ncbi:MAG: hypothetical protein KKD48_02605 [Nanoarchaeota archaeon]|nr:hypothetical protein [Nanoarchaeota archaeon]
MENKYIGVLWLNDSTKGKYLAGKITIDEKEIPIVIFKNNRKRPDKKDPDYNILMSQPKDETKDKNYINPDEIPF